MFHYIMEFCGETGKIPGADVRKGRVRLRSGL